MQGLYNIQYNTISLPYPLRRKGNFPPSGGLRGAVIQKSPPSFPHRPFADFGGRNSVYHYFKSIFNPKDIKYLLIAIEGGFSPVIYLYFFLFLMQNV